jgi:surfactin synthase thioesterase subunit
MEVINLICLPFAGGNKYSYQVFLKHVPSFIKLVPVELPGRSSRFNEPLLTKMDKIVDDVYMQVGPLLDKPYAIFGHSMGTLLGYLLVKKIIREGRKQPIHLFFTGGIGPSVRERESPRYLMTKKEFFEKVKELGGLQDEILQDESLLDFIEPILRSDMQAIETYEYKESQPFDIPITVMIGVDEKATREEAEAWKIETTSPVEVIQMPGNHFFIFQFDREIIKVIASKLNTKVFY